MKRKGKRRKGDTTATSSVEQGGSLHTVKELMHHVHTLPFQQTATGVPWKGSLKEGCASGAWRFIHVIPALKAETGGTPKLPGLPVCAISNPAPKKEWLCYIKGSLKSIVPGLEFWKLIKKLNKKVKRAANS